ncbi:MAG: CoA ester lyase [Tissierellia bacterium]|nr:CoA ester lyase [Tissierellia bacterium]
MKYRSLLFIPGNAPGMLQNMDILGADAYLIDLEDAVSIENKDAARLLVKEFLEHHKPDLPIFVRINPPDTAYFNDDIEALKYTDITGFMLPKAGVESVKSLDGKLQDTNLSILALIETARSLEMAFETLGASKRVEGVLLGAEDLTLDLGAKRTKASTEIEYARKKIVAAARAQNVEAIDTPWTDTEDLEGLERDALYAESLGFTGKALISPRHTTIVNRVFSPSQEDIQYALRVFEALKVAKEEGKGAFSLDGKMVDKPIILRATNVLKQTGDFKEEYDALL